MKGQFLLASFLAATVQASADNACAEVRELYLASGDDSVKVPAQLAYDCMSECVREEPVSIPTDTVQATVPFNQSAAGIVSPPLALQGTILTVHSCLHGLYSPISGLAHHLSVLERASAGVCREGSGQSASSIPICIRDY